MSQNEGDKLKKLGSIFYWYYSFCWWKLCVLLCWFVCKI